MEEEDFAVIERKERKGTLSFRPGSRSLAHTQSRQKEKDRAEMRPWFTPRRMTDPLSGASFNAITDERTLITIARAKRHDAEERSLLRVLPLLIFLLRLLRRLLSFSFLGTFAFYPFRRTQGIVVR